jgi:hypothetical protein
MAFPIFAAGNIAQAKPVIYEYAAPQNRFGERHLAAPGKLIQRGG